MSSRLIPLLLACLLGVAIAGISACGSSKSGRQLSTSEASELVALLDQIDGNYVAKNCKGAERYMSEIELDTENLSPKIDENLRNALSDSVGHLRSLLLDQCQSKLPTTTSETTIPTVTEPTTTESTTPSTTAAVSTTTTSTSTSTTTTPDSGSGGSGSGNDSGGSGGAVGSN